MVSGMSTESKSPRVGDIAKFKVAYVCVCVCVYIYTWNIWKKRAQRFFKLSRVEGFVRLL